MKRGWKRVGLGVVVAVAIAAVSAAVFVATTARAFDESMAKVYDVPLSPVTVPADPAALARGKHLVESVAACTGKNCHGADLGGGETLSIGPLATLTGPNITPKGMLAVYKDAELVRLVRHGLTIDGRSVRFMPVQDFGWLSDADVTSIVAYLRTVPGVDRPNGPLEIKTFGKIIDRKDGIILDVARRIRHEAPDLAPPPSATKEYGRYVGKLCTGCHGEHLSGGPIPGAPSNFSVPLNLTPDPTGLQGWAYEDLDKLLTTGVRKNGKQMDPLMPIENFGKLDDTEKHALFLYLTSLPPLSFGGR
jgi:cytochrome c553